MQYRFNVKRPSLLLLSLVCFVCSCTPLTHLTDQKNQDDSLQSKKYILTAVGYAPIAAQKGATLDMQITNAIKASKLEAYKELAEQIYGVLVNSKSTVSHSSLQNDKIESTVKGLVRAARVLKSYHEAGMYITELEFDMKKLKILEEAGFNDRNIHVIKVMKAERQVYY